MKKDGRNTRRGQSKTKESKENRGTREALATKIIIKMDNNRDECNKTRILMILTRIKIN